MKVAVPTVPPQDTALLALTSSALVIIVLVLLALSIIYCKRFWKSQCQRGESMPAALLFRLPLLFAGARGPLLAGQSIAPSVAALAAYRDPSAPLLVQDKALILLFTSAGPLLCLACPKARRSLAPPWCHDWEEEEGNAVNRLPPLPGVPLGQAEAKRRFAGQDRSTGEGGGQ